HFLKGQPQHPCRGCSRYACRRRSDQQRRLLTLPRQHFPFPLHGAVPEPRRAPARNTNIDSHSPAATRCAIAKNREPHARSRLALSFRVSKQLTASANGAVQRLLAWKISSVTRCPVCNCQQNLQPAPEAQARET